MEKSLGYGFEYNFMKGKDFVFKEKEKMRKPEKKNIVCYG